MFNIFFLWSQAPLRLRMYVDILYNMQSFRGGVDKHSKQYTTLSRWILDSPGGF